MRGNLSPVLLLTLALITGCAHRARQDGGQAQLIYVSKPVIDFGRGGGGLPVEGVKELRTAPDLLLGLTQGYHSRLDLPKDHDPFTINGEFPHLDLLKIDPETHAVITHKAPEKPPPIEDLAAAVAKLKGEAGRRDEVFRKQVEAEKSRGAVLNSKFDELLRQAKENPDSTPPKRDIDLD